MLCLRVVTRVVPITILVKKVFGQLVGTLVILAEQLVLITTTTVRPAAQTNLYFVGPLLPRGWVLGFEG